MNKQQKIIVSIVGITIVLLALLGITYAYYLTRIEGNTNTNSISITTANLKLKYEDGNGLLTATNITPGKQVEFKTTGNDTTTEKTFTVTNSGNSTIEGYAVSLDYAYIADTMPSIFERPEDFQITLTCSTNKTGESCNGFTGNFNNESIMMTSNDIDENEVHTYSLSIYYNDPQVDQSNDMGKNLNLKVQIYNISETTDIEGTITGVDSKYSVKIESEPKMSTIINGKYNFKGVEIGTHTLSVLDKDGAVVDKEYIVVKSGITPAITTTKATIDNTEVDAIEITITSEQRLVKLVTKVESNVLSFDTTTSSTEIFNPYSNNKNSLAYNIINNSYNVTNEQNELGYAKYTNEPLSLPGMTVSGEIYDSDIYEEVINVSVADSEKEINIIYIDDVEFSSKEGFKIKNVKKCKYIDCLNKLKDKYILKSDITDNDSESLIIMFPINEIYKINDISENSINLTKINVNTIEIEENILTKINDDYGISYYYRGNVKNNYLNFAGMCWKIVRIEGDGSVKLILEDYYALCNDTSLNDINDDNIIYTGNFEIGGGYYGYDIDENSNHIINYLNPQQNGMSYAFNNFQKNKLKNYYSSLKSGGWCYDETTFTNRYGTEKLENKFNLYNSKTKFYYGTFIRVTGLRKIYLTCDGKYLNTFSNGESMYVSALVAEEVSLAGAKSTIGTTYYLTNEYSTNNGIEWFILSPRHFDGTKDRTYVVSDSGGMTSIVVSASWSYRPAIQLKNGITISSGDGTQSNPYVVE